MKFATIVNLTRFTDHKLCGIYYILAEIYTLYSILFRADAFYDNYFEFLMPYVLGVCTCCAALRNFGHLSKTDDNAGMFVDNRTFSYPFLVENLWFQVITLLNQGAYMGMFYNFNDAGLYATSVLGAKDWNDLFYWLRLAAMVGIFWWFQVRTLFPKTSYATWEDGNKEKGHKKYSAGGISWINFQVKVVRFNFVMKSKICSSYFSKLHFLGLLSPQWRFVPLFLVLDQSHNITTAFFLQTLKFHKFISAATFSFLFNLTPYMGNTLMAYYVWHEGVNWEVLAPLAIVLAMHLNLVYPKVGPQRLVSCIMALISLSNKIVHLESTNMALFSVIGIVAFICLAPEPTFTIQHRNGWLYFYSHLFNSLAETAVVLGVMGVISYILNPSMKKFLQELAYGKKNKVSRKI